MRILRRAQHLSRYGIVLAGVAAALGHGLPARAQQGHTRATPAPAALRYDVDLTDTAHYVFVVTLRVPPLSAANSVFEFAATAPGTYQTMNIGRFVRGFMAYDVHGAPVATEQAGTNEWRLSDPERVRRITYRVLATRDTTVSTDPIYPMCGTALDASYALINGQGVFGFPRGMQAVPLAIRLKTPADGRTGHRWRKPLAFSPRRPTTGWWIRRSSSVRISPGRHST